MATLQLMNRQQAGLVFCNLQTKAVNNNNNSNTKFIKRHNAVRRLQRRVISIGADFSL